MSLSSITPEMADKMFADLGKDVGPAKPKLGMAGKFLQAIPVPALRGAIGFGGGLMRGADPFRAGVDALMGVSPQAGFAAQTVILPDRMTAAGT